MPLNAAKPKMVSQIQADQFAITGFKVLLEENVVVVYYSYSLKQADGTFLKMGESNFKLKASILGVLKPEGTKTYYNNIKTLLYNQGQAIGVFPAGTID